MTLETFISQDWDDLAIDDGTFVHSQKSHFARLTDRNDNQIITEVESISFSPEINTAPSLSVDVEPKEEFEGIDFLGGILELFVSDDIIFAGEIKSFDFSQEEGEWYQVSAYSPGRKLADEVIDERIQNHVLQDYLAKTIDRYNEFDDEMFNMIDTNQETISGDVDILDIGARRIKTDSSEITYSSVGSEASDIDTMYVKYNGSLTIDILDSSDSSVIYSEDLSNSNIRYGEWYGIEPNLSENVEYDIKFSLASTEDSILYDWISLNETVIDRIVEPFEAENLFENKQIESVETQDQWSEVLPDFGDGDPYTLQDGTLSYKQTCWTTDTEDQTTNTYTRSSSKLYETASDGQYATLLSNSQSIEMSFTIDYPVLADDLVLRWRQAWEVGADDNFSGDLGQLFLSADVSGGNLDGTVIWTSSGPSDVRDNEGSWIWDDGNNLSEFNLQGDDQYLQPDTYTITILLKDEDFDSVNREDPGWAVDIISPHDARYEYTFDNTLNEPEGYLDGPELYGQGVTIDASGTIANANITSTSLNISTNETNPGQSLQLRYSEGGTWLPNDGSQNNTDTVTVDSNSPTRFVQPRFSMNGIGQRNTATPRNGYNPQEIYSYEFISDADDLEVIFDREFQGTRLSVISSIADDSFSVFRWEGNNCRVFKEGSRVSDVSLVAEDITSSVDIEDTYSSVEVIGTGGVRSGVVEAENAPDFVDRHREIRDRTITEETDANSKAQSFLVNNSEIEYSGDITTLPTRVPIGDEISGENFLHGESGIITKASYSKNRTDVSVGKIKDLGFEFLSLRRNEDSSKQFDTQA